jgi:SAM-dependent methyltransferase
MGELSAFDVAALGAIRRNVERFMAHASRTYGTERGLLLDVAPQDHAGAAPFFPGQRIETLDIDPRSGATYVADLCRCQGAIASDRFDYVVCTEVLEHTLQPFDAVAGIHHLLKPAGYAFVTTPFNFRMHGPLPDCWRFTEHGLRALFQRFEIVELSALETDDRWLMPLHYTLVVRKP